jgi:hypothetical protein
MSVFHSGCESEPSHKILINADQSPCLRLTGVRAPALSIKVVKHSMNCRVQAENFLAYATTTAPSTFETGSRGKVAAMIDL